METSGFVQKLLISFCTSQNSNNSNFKQLFLFVEKELIITKVPWCFEL